MSCVAPVLPPEGQRSTFSITDTNYARCLHLLIDHGDVPGVPLTHLEFRILCFLLKQRPGQYAAHHRTIAERVNSNEDSVGDALRALEKKGLLTSRRIGPNQSLPWGSKSRTNVNVYTVVLEALASLLMAGPATLPSWPSLAKAGPSPDHYAATPSATPLPEEPPPTPRPVNPPSSTTADSPPSLRTEIDLERKQASPLPPATQRRRAVTSQLAKPSEVEAVTPIDHSVRSFETSELERLIQTWNTAGLPRTNDLAMPALRARLRQGATLGSIEAAILGAQHSDDSQWLRTKAKHAFAVVFKSLSTIERYAHVGRKILDDNVMTFGTRRSTPSKTKPLSDEDLIPEETREEVAAQIRASFGEEAATKEATRAAPLQAMTSDQLERRREALREQGMALAALWSENAK